MNFFESQAERRAQTYRLVVMFLVAVVALVVMTNLLIMGVFGFLTLGDEPLTLAHLKSQFDWQVFSFVGVLVATVVLIGSVYKVNELGTGGKVVAQSLGGTLITHSTKVHEYRVLLNVVEEMAIASGTPVPPVYVLKDENGINAFAAGFTVDDAVIGITQGAIECFNREELQGVIAHEFSHIVHGDMRLNIRLMGVLHGILLIGLIGYHLLDATRGSSRSKDGNQLALLGLGLMAIGYSGTFFGNMIKASVSRKREYLADASAVQYTRNNTGIANALKKIGGYTDGSYMSASEAPSASHMFFANGIQSKLQSVFATHPPLDKRIKVLQPGWLGKFPKVKRGQGLKSEIAGVAGFSESTVTASEGAAVTSPIDDLSSTVGQLTGTHIERAQACVSSIPSSIKQHIYTLDGARAFIYGLLIDPVVTNDTYFKQWSYLEKNISQDSFECLELMYDDIRQLSPALRLPLIEIALPQLRSMLKIDYLRLMDNLEWLIDADGKRDLFEWSVERIVGHYLKVQFYGADYEVIKYHSMNAVKEQLEIILSVLFQHFVEPNQQLLVLNRTKSVIGIDDIEILNTDLLSHGAFCEAVDKLYVLSPKLKEKVLKAIVFMVTQDKVLSIEEQETLRALADSLGCPMPIIY